MTDSLPSARLRRNAVFGVAVVLVVIAGTAVLGSNVLESPEQAAARAAAPEWSTLTAAVEKRVLIDGGAAQFTVSPSTTLQITGPVLSDEGVPVLTSTPIEEGGEVTEGAVIVGISGRPVIALEGATASYRGWVPGVTGPDIEQLQTALRRLGMYVGTSTGQFDAATQAAVSRLYLERGYELATTDVTKAMALRQASETVRAAENEVGQAETALKKAFSGPTPEVRAATTERDSAARQVDLVAAESTQAQHQAQLDVEQATIERDQVEGDPSSTASQKNATRVALERALGQLQVVNVQTANQRAAAAADLAVAEARLIDVRNLAGKAEQDSLTDARMALSAARLSYEQASISAGAQVSFGEIVFVPKLPAVLTSIEDMSSDAGDSQTVPSVATLGVAPVVLKGTVDSETATRFALDTTVQIGEGASVTDGKVISANPLSDRSGVEVIVEPSKALGWVHVAERVTVRSVTSSTEIPVLAVPTSAVVQAPDGQVTVDVMDSSGKSVETPVRVGISANGWIGVMPVSGALEEGDRVVIGTERPR